MTETTTPEAGEAAEPEFTDVHPDEVTAAGQAAAEALRQVAALTAGAPVEVQFAALDALLSEGGMLAALTALVTAARPNLPAYDDLSTERAALALDEAGNAIAEARDELEYAQNLLSPLVG
jgi:hypothetical protein